MPTLECCDLRLLPGLRPEIVPSLTGPQIQSVSVPASRLVKADTSEAEPDRNIRAVHRQVL